MSGFDRTPLVYIGPDGSSFKMAAAACYYGSQGDSWTIPEGFRTDFATIPAAVSWAVPKLGAYSLAALVHDLLCEGLNDWHHAKEAAGHIGEIYYATNVSGRLRYRDRWVPVPTANAVDTDAIFYKIARDYGTDPITANLLWVGVRWGALANPARRAGWLRTAPKVLGLSLLFAPVLVPATVLAVAGRLALRAARTVARLLGR